MKTIATWVTYFDISKWTAAWHRRDSIVWINTDIPVWTTETIWNQWGLYSFPTSATNFYVSSSSTSDTSVTLLLEVLDINYKRSTVTVTLNWQTPVLVSWGQYFRLNKALNVSNNAAVWNIYISKTNSVTAWVPNTASDILWKIVIGNNIMHNSVYTVPLWETMFVQTISAYIWKGNDAKVFIYLKPENSTQFLNIEYNIFESVFQDVFPTPSIVSEKTDIEVRMKALTNNIDVSINSQFILVENDHVIWPGEFVC